MNNRQKQIHTIDMIFPLIFIVFFGFCAVSLVLSGAHIYQKTTDGLKQNYTVRTAAAYVHIYLYKGKLRELFTKKERGIEWESGQELVSADTFSVIKQKEDLLRIHLSGSGQEELVYARIYGEDER